MRKPVIGVMGGAAVDEATFDQAVHLGRLIAERGWILLNGGRDTGVMQASARGAREAGGVVVGILPDLDNGQASPDLDYAIVTGLGDGRNLINVLSSDVVVACRGALGTTSEIVLALKHGKRVILLARKADASWAGFMSGGQLSIAKDPAEAVEQVAVSLKLSGR